MLRVAGGDAVGGDDLGNAVVGVVAVFGDTAKPVGVACHAVFAIKAVAGLAAVGVDHAAEVGVVVEQALNDGVFDVVLRGADFN